MGKAVICSHPVFLLLVLTNDLHQLVFSFPAGSVWSDTDNGYAYGYYLVMGWIIACALTAFVIMLIKCRVAQRKNTYRHFCCPALSIRLYLCQRRQVDAGDREGPYSGAMPDVYHIGSCIQCGLIQTNTGYDGMFKGRNLPRPDH